MEMSPDYDIIKGIKNDIDKIYQENLGNQFIYISHTFKFAQYIKELLYKEHINHPLIQKLNDDIRYDICNTIYKNSEYLKDSNMEITFERNGNNHKFKFGFIICQNFNVFDKLLKEKENKKLTKKINDVLAIKYTKFSFVYRITDSNNIEAYFTVYTNNDLHFRVILMIVFSIDNVQAIQNMKKENYSDYKNNIFTFKYWKCNSRGNYPLNIKEKYFDNLVWELLHSIIKDYNKYFLNIISQTYAFLDTYKN